MEQLVKPEYIVALTVGLIGFVGVVIGALITPLTINYIEKQKIKRELKSNLLSPKSLPPRGLLRLTNIHREL